MSVTNWATAIKKTVVASEQQRHDVAAARAQWQAWQKQCDLSKLVFLDETSTSTDMIRRYGRTLGGARCVDNAPAGHWLTLTFIAGLRVDQLTAPWCLNQAMNGEAFKEYLSSQLGPTLRPGDIVICDNLPAHKVADVQALIEARGATMKYLPPYSPDLNPIEQVFAKLKALLRKTAERTYDKLWQTIGQIMDQFQADECLNYFKNAGYVSN
ncbi:MAG: IS630 family transposase [Methylobacter sp.]